MKKIIPDCTFNVQDFQNGDIKIVFEIIDAKQKQEKKIKNSDKKGF